MSHDPQQVPPDDRTGSIVGPLEVGPVAHGGHCVARHEGRVIFVRHALPGERVMVRLTDATRPSFWRGDAVEVLEPAADRVVPPCPVAGRCGGCDFQHVSHAGQRRLKTAVVREQLQHLAGITWRGSVEAVEPLDGWRTRTRFAVERDWNEESSAPVVGMHEHRSHVLVPLPEQGCMIASPKVPDVAELTRIAARQPTDEIRIVVPARGVPRVVTQREQGAETVLEHNHGRDFRVRADGFWQVHPRAAETLVETVLQMLAPRKGEHALDLYCGVGLFAGALADAGAKVVGVEQVHKAVQLARGNVPKARFIAAPLAKALRQLPPRVDVIVLDPPRTGAGAQVVAHLSGLDARAIAYVACDPAALARDLKSFAEHGYTATSIRGFDLFPMTHHVECVALLEPTA